MVIREKLISHESTLSPLTYSVAIMAIREKLFSHKSHEFTPIFFVAIMVREKPPRMAP
jgi:hypothetical protein